MRPSIFLLTASLMALGAAFIYTEANATKANKTNALEDAAAPPVEINEKLNKELMDVTLDNISEKVFDNKDVSHLAKNKIKDIKDIKDIANEGNDVNSVVMLESEDSAETKDLELYNVHTKEKVEVTFWVDGDYQPKALDKLDQFMRDWRKNQVIEIDPELYVLLHDLHDNVDAEAPIHLISGHRSKKTNDTLRSLGRKTAKKSQHVLGKAADITIPGVPVSVVRKEALKMERGGVGYYPKSNFVHVDTGRVRQW